MGVVIGIDVGGSTTKIVGIRVEGDKKTIINPQLVSANDPITATYGAFGKFTDENGIAFSEIDRIMVTGVGASYIKHDMYGIKSVIVPEFSATALGGLYLSELKDCLVVSMGTGTAMVHAIDGEKPKYLGGTGVGGGTLIGLSKLLLNAETVEHIEECGAPGNLANVDLRIRDITANGSHGELVGELTASNFGNISDGVTKEDIAKGIINLVSETIGVVSIFAARSVGVSNIVLTGNLTRIELVKEKFDFFNSLEKIYGVNFIIPNMAEFATVIGTALYEI